MFKRIENSLSKYSIIWALSFIVGFAILLRFNGLIFQSYWFDELFSVYVSNPENSIQVVISKTLADVHPPLYQILLWFWYHTFGYTDWAGRAFSAFFGSLGIISMYYMAKEFYNREVGLYAATIASVNYFLIYFSQETRAYALLFFLTTLSYLYFVRLLKNYEVKSFLLYLFFTSAVLYTHYFGFFLLFTQLSVFLYILIIQTRKRKELFRLGLMMAIALSIIVLPLLQTIIGLTHKGQTWMEVPASNFAIEYMKGYILSPFLQKIFLFLIVSTFVSMWFKKTENYTKIATFMLFLWIVLGYLVPYIRSITAVPLLSPKNTIIVVPPLITIVAFGIYQLKYYWIKIVLTGAIVFFSLYHLYRMEYYSTVTKDQFREVLKEINKVNNKIPVYDIVMHESSFKSYYFRTQAEISNINLNIRSSQELPLEYEDSSEPSCFWVVQAHKNYLEKGKILKKKELKLLKTIDKFQAQGLLFGYKKTLQECIK